MLPLLWQSWDCTARNAGGLTGLITHWTCFFPYSGKAWLHKTSCAVCVCTAISESNGTIAIFVSKMAYFKGAWRKVKVLPRPWAWRSKSSSIRPLKWGTVRLWTPSGSKMASRQSWKNEEKVRLSKEALTKTDFVYTLSTLTAGHFWTTGSSETYCTSF